MSFLKNAKYSENIKHETDSVGGGFQPLASGVYTAKIVHAIEKQFESGTGAIEFEFDLEDGRKYRETVYVTDTNGDITQEFDGKKSYRKGFLIADSIALLGASTSILDVDTEEKVIELYNFDVGQKVPTKVQAFADLHGKTVKLGIIKTLDFKSVKNESTGKWEKTAETKETNTINKVFRVSDDMTTNEIRSKKETATFINDWKNSWEGKVDDKTKGKASTATTTQSKPTQQREALF